MKARKWVYILTAIIMIMTMLASCAQQPAAPAEPAKQADQAEQPKKIKIACLTGNIDDNGWNTAGYRGCKAAADQFGAEMDSNEEVSIQTAEKVLRDYASQGYDLIICHSSTSKEAIFNTAKDYPETKFLWTDGDEASGNVAVIKPWSQEASYLAGILAGKMTKSNIIGVVGGMDIPSTHRSYYGFEMGVKEVNPDAKLMVAWIGNFVDMKAGKEAALSQIEAGADIVWGNGDGQNIGVLQAAEEKNVYAIGAVTDQYNVAPKVVLTSVDWGFLYGMPLVVKDIVDGKFEGKVYDISLAQGADLSPYHDNADKIPDDVKKLIEEKRKAIIDGTLKIPIVDTAQ
ncbi:MAG: BMP family protein [Anaerolineae bacterium]|nr:BMP family protein [Anaerolineae bacterium]